MSDEDILILWNEANHNQSVTQQILDFARLIEECTRIKRTPSLVYKLLRQLEDE